MDCFNIFASISGVLAHFKLERLIEGWVQSLLDDLSLQLLKWERDGVKQDHTKRVLISPHACQEACKAEQTDQLFQRCPFLEDPLEAGINIYRYSLRLPLHWEKVPTLHSTRTTVRALAVSSYLI